MKSVKLSTFKRNSIISSINDISYGLKLIKAPDIWKEGFKGKGVIISVVDTGCDYTHFNLKNNIIGGYNFTSEYNENSNNFSDQNGHGTHIAGIIAANSDNGTGIIGVAPEAKLLILKSLSPSGIGNYKDLIAAIEYSINWRGQHSEKVRIISMSLGLYKNINELHNIIKRAVNNNIIVVCSSGNDGDGQSQTIELQYPAVYPEVIQVGAIDINKTVAYFSNTNNEVDILAPGVNITSTFLNGTYATFSGTSMAAPHVAGVIALLINKYEEKYSRTLTYSEIIKLTYNYFSQLSLLQVKT